MGVGAAQPQLPAAHRQFQDAGKADALGLQGVAGDGRGEGRLHNLDVVAEMAAAGGVAQGDLGAGRRRIQREIILDLDGDADVGMVAQVLPHAGQFVDDGQAQFPQMVGGADAGQQHQLGRGDGAGGQDDVRALHDEHFAAAFHLNAHRLFALKDDAAAGYIGADGEVEAVARLAQVSDGSAHPHAVGVVHRDGADAAGFGMVHIRVVGVAGGAAGVPERDLGGQPVLAAVAAHRDRAGVAVEVVGDVGVGFQLAEIGQAVGEFPFVVAQRRPGVVVLGHAAQQHLPVDGRGTADDPAPGDGHPLGLAGVVGPESPVVRGVNGRRRLVVAVLEVVGVEVKVGVVRPGLQHQHGAVGILGQPRRHRTAGRAGADDDDIVFHCAMPPVVWGWQPVVLLPGVIIAGNGGLGKGWGAPLPSFQHPLYRHSSASRNLAL